ncbi:unnamed protein product, partial [Lymnaea stagnalis]
QTARTDVAEGLQITITTYNDTSFKVSYITDELIDIIFDKEVTAQRIRITGSLVESICEVYISGGSNVAIQKNATQSGIFTEKDRSLASNAVDGNRLTDWNYGSCSHTDQLGAYILGTHSWS